MAPNLQIPETPSNDRAGNRVFWSIFTDAGHYIERCAS